MYQQLMNLSANTPKAIKRTAYTIYSKLRGNFHYYLPLTYEQMYCHYFSNYLINVYFYCYLSFCKSLPNFSSKAFLAPMAGITDHPFRVLCREMGAGVVYSEFVSANGIVRENMKTLELMKFTFGLVR